MGTKRLNLRKDVHDAVFHGIIAWLVYGLIESLFLLILPLFTKSKYDYVPLNGGFTILTFAVYAVLGAVLGVCVAIFFHFTSRKNILPEKEYGKTIFPLFAVLSVLVVFLVHLAIQLSFHHGFVIFVAMISFMVAACLFFSAGSITRFNQLRFITNPWTVSLIILGPLWIVKEFLEGHSIITKGVSVFFYLGLIVILSVLVRKTAITRRSHEDEPKCCEASARYLITCVILAFLSVGVSLFFSQKPITREIKASNSGSSRPNIVLITMDTVSAGHLSLYGYERKTTPHIREFSKEATLYTNAFVSGDMTLSTHASIFTGLYVRRHGAHFDVPDSPNGRPLNDNFTTIAEILSAYGYNTMGVVSNVSFLSHAFHMDQGFQYYDQRQRILFINKIQPFFLRKGLSDIVMPFTRLSAYELKCRRAKIINSEAFELLEKVRNDDRPFFLFINYMDAHYPYLPPSPYDRLYPGKSEAFETRDHRIKMKKEIMTLERTVDKKEYEHYVSQYDGGISYMDFHIGRLMKRLRKLGLYENSLIIVTSDHGEAFGERNLVGHGISVYQDMIHVPLVIKYPGERDGEGVDVFVSTVDLMPTILYAAGIDIPETVHGESLQELDREEPRIIVSESYPSNVNYNLHPRFQRIERAVLSRNYKFISSTAGKRELFDLSRDPGEEDNLYGVNTSLSRYFEKSLKTWLEEIKEETHSSNKLGKEAINNLKSLGYIQ